ncbi:DoxX family protein [Aquabacterium sp. J223]|uniref:DoxX family protein n=1 Tax=Aquabacterium sp. J223 TaxID=2898431 RepID=UPI0021AD8FA4|nr:DoxX family protein [Aquabacterium sp. J223]UUX96181.1 DoxX family protein [Aquabacterium sp. J223]
MPSSPTVSPALPRQFDLAALLLRLGLGVLVLFHGVAKVAAGPGYVGTLVAKAGLPELLAYGVYVGEVVAPLMLIVGLWTRLAAWVVVVNMLFAVALVHASQLFSVNARTGGYELELQALFLLAAVVVALIGPGRFSLDARRG